jgi:flavin reductase (DIM6/NTAB) family NADH-FMN oxidoreductase RutF
VDKVAVCRFKVWYGKLADAPLIEQCPVNLACKAVQIIELGSHHLIICQIEETFVSEECLTEGKPDMKKVKPFVFLMAPMRQYTALGENLGESHSIGKTLTE